ncbi:MAG: hypothetical protein HVN35_09675 [Methanobacteriaceae archaeon]|nr:hypothetical protein [Methanobacteriaceae archaeon]
MEEIIPILLIFLITGLIFSSGCIESNKANSTWGEKKISLDLINVANNTKGNRSERNESIYYVYGDINNNNPYDALNVKIKVTTYYSNGTVFAVNDTPYLDPKTIPAKGTSYFYAQFDDPEKKIARFEVKIIDAKGEY